MHLSSTLQAVKKDARLAEAMEEHSGSPLVASLAELRVPAFLGVTKKVLSRTSTSHTLRGCVDPAQDTALSAPKRSANRPILPHAFDGGTLGLCSIAQPNMSSSTPCCG